MEILIVDSSIHIIERLEEILSESGNIYTIHKAVSYAEAKMIFNKIEPDFVLLDDGLPGSESFKILREIRKITRKSFVIMLTSGTPKYIKDEYTFVKADFLFDKYYDFEKICDFINTVGHAHENANL